VHSCEISEADFTCGSYWLEIEHVLFWKFKMVVIINVLIVMIPSKGISRSDELKMCWKCGCYFSSKYKGNCLTGVNIGDYGKGEFGNKHQHTFLELIQELDKVEGIERLRISSIEPNLLKKWNNRVCLKSRTLFRIFIFRCNNEVTISWSWERRYYEVYTERVKNTKSCRMLV
jgi:threonylcarbamoyladenosine tRNA methylthiotransferase MtaB